MAQILTLDQARAALGWAEGANANRNQELLDIDIPSATEAVESICGRMEDRRDTWSSDDPSPLTTPWPVATIKSVTVGSTAITGYTFVAGVLTITDPAYTAGAQVTVVAGGLPTPASVTQAAGIILAHLWNARRQGRAGGSAVRGEVADAPTGFAIPRRAEQLLEPYRTVWGFA